MKKIFDGKTKNVFKLENGNYLLAFKDDVTGVDGVFDPGANTVGLSIDGAGEAGLAMSEYFFKILAENAIPTHFVAANVQEKTMEVRPAKVFGSGIEVICRYRAVGSFFRRYGAYIAEGSELPAFIEVTLKDDLREDPPITRDALDALGIFSSEMYDDLKAKTRKICDIIKEELAKIGLDLYDIKLEFGACEVTGEVILIDEISGGNMRVYDKDGKYIEPIELSKMIIGKLKTDN